MFFLYCLLLAELLLFGRQMDSTIPIGKYFAMYANAMPFRTLARYISYFLKMRDLVSFRLAFLNIGGNFVLFLPMGCLLPVLFPTLERKTKCLFVIFCVILSAELLQGLFRVGVPDIDDLSVNMLGAYIGVRGREGRRRRRGILSLFCHRNLPCRIHW